MVQQLWRDVTRLEEEKSRLLEDASRSQVRSHSWRFRGGFVFKVHRFGVSLNSRLESNQAEKEEDYRAADVQERLALRYVLIPIVS